MIIPLEDFPKLREEKLKGKKIVAASGFFDPIHPGHVSYIMESKKFGDVLVVIVDGDQRAVTKKGKAFMAELDRARIVDGIKGVDYVVIYNHPTKNDCIEAVDIIKPDVFTKGGDRAAREDIPEYDTIEKNGGRIEFNVGDPKYWSSSNYLQEWVDFVNSQQA
ncbi:adenylyltransferase/cytidyltransferase family protein [Candidatus Dojkabacteria bacterium]|jgi:rfaE bifunctional protein nucleotidyltransferase chain/domain|nr:adenylyltransferase/cytidyltransferase family protein [Candidatus Dojkabacteria bacterium]